MVLIVNGVVLDSIIQHVYPVAEMRYCRRVGADRGAANPKYWESRDAVDHQEQISTAIGDFITAILGIPAVVGQVDGRLRRRPGYR